MNSDITSISLKDSSSYAKVGIPKEDEFFMVTYGDGVSNINIKDLVKFHKKQKKIGTLSGVHPHSKYGLISVNNRNIATKFVEKPVLKEWVNGGFMVFRHEAFDYFEPGEMEHEGLKRLIAKNELAVFIHNGFWRSMDTYPDVDNLNKLWSDGPEWKVWQD